MVALERGLKYDFVRSAKFLQNHALVKWRWAICSISVMWEESVDMVGEVRVRQQSGQSPSFIHQRGEIR